MSGQTRLSALRHRKPRPRLDKTAVRHFVYTLRDEFGAALYVGRSCNVAQRIRGHVSEASRPLTPAAVRKALWLADVRSVTMTGPYAWDEAVEAEREQIELAQPPGNVDLTERDRRPAVAARSARRGASPASLDDKREALAKVSDALDLDDLFARKKDA